jgi:catechol-2,3-dioxygenase
MRESAGGNKGFTVLFDEQGLVLTLMKGRSDAVRYPDTFHIGFGQPNEAAVNQLNQRLKNDGYDIQPPEHSHAYTFYVQAPGGFTVEVMS